MTYKRAFLFLFLGLVAAGFLGAQDAKESPEAIPDKDLGLSKSSVFEVPSPEAVALETSDPGEEPVLSRPHAEAPPLVPHGVRDYLPITREDNLCIECHLANEAGESVGKPIPASHLTDWRNSPAEVGRSVVGARHVCVSCHVAQADNPLLVENAFRP